jgi:Fibronectin type III domain
MKEECAFRSAFLAPVIQIGSPLCLIGAFLLFVAVGVYADTSGQAQGAEQKQNPDRSAVFQRRVGTHVTRGRPSLSGTAPKRAGFERSSENSAQSEAALASTVLAPTRSGFIANWNNVSGATGYRLDVSTSSSLRDCITGYQNLDVGNATSRLISGLRPGTTYYYRVQAYDALGIKGESNVMTATTASSSGLVINATLDSSITTDPNSAAIQSAINHAIAIYEALFSDPITVSILFRYSTTAPDGSDLPSGSLAMSSSVIYEVPWDIYVTALEADAKTANDVSANASLPATPLSTNLLPSGPDGRASGLDTPPAMLPDGSLLVGGPYDGIVTLNSAESFDFNRTPSDSTFDALQAIEHEIDEILGLGSYLNAGSTSDLRPEDLFTWSAPGARNLISSGSRYFSIDSGTTDIVDLNQDPNGDFGDWLSSLTCPQENPYVQDAFACTNQFSDVTETSPEGIALDVIGYDLVNPASLPYDPALDASVIEWLRADSLSLSDGASVATWTASKGVSLTATAGHRPVFHSSSSRNGLPVVSTDGLGQFMSGSLGPREIPNQIFIVSRTAFFGYDTFYVLDLDPSGDPHDLEGFYLFYSHYVGSGGSGYWDMGFTDGSWQITCLEVNGDSSRWRVNNGDWHKGTPVFGLNDATGYNGVVIGADHAGSHFSQTNYAEIIIRSGTSNGIEARAVINYLNNKWGVFATPTPTPSATPTPTPTPSATPTPTSTPSAAPTAAPTAVPIITVSASAATVPKGANGAFIVTRSVVSSQPLTVSYTVGGNAQLGADYTLGGSPGQVVIPAAQASTTVTLEALDNGLTKRSEKVKFSLTTGAGYKLPKRAGRSATITIPRH